MTKHPRTRWAVALLATIIFLCPRVSSAQQVAVKYKEGIVRGFLVLRTLNDETIAAGDLAQHASGDRVTTHVVYRFKDGSVQEETAVFSQRGSFRLLSDHLLQKGPAFKSQTDLSINCSTGQVTVRYTDDNGKEKVITDHLKLPADLANGVVLTMLKNIPPGTAKTTLSMVVATPKPRLVKLVISPEGEDTFSVAESTLKAVRYDVKVDIGGAAGLVAPIVGKQPPDTHVWLLEGEAPAFVKYEGPQYEGGPIWRIELTSPIWPQKRAEGSPKN
ncbi:MAG TPA: hypothetical protein VN881_00415 [Candidatus Acidoferrales bacterium]|nr:hypothetical protein [Candidatus Acidoferrales bacterium]